MADTYSVVDLSRKKKNRSLQENNAGLEPGTYSVLGQRNFDSEGQDSPQAVTTDAFSNAVYEMPSGSTHDAKGTYTLAASATSNEKNKKKESDGRKFAFCIAVTVVVLLIFMLTTIACLAILFAEVNTLKSEMLLGLEQEQISSSEQPNEAFNYDQLSYLNKSLSAYKEVIHQQLSWINFTVTENHEAQANSTQRLSNLLQVSITDITTLDSQFSSLERTIEQLQDRIFPAFSCATLPRSSPSGYYWVRASNGSAVRVYCDMTRSCGNFTGGWMRVAYLNMKNDTHRCPTGFTQRSDIRACVKIEDGQHCSSVIYSTLNTYQYSRVCGRVIGYQYGTTDAFLSYNAYNNIGIEDNYVDGVSLTHGHYSKQHIWTFAAAYSETAQYPRSSCQCIVDNAPAPPWFVGRDYFCDTGARNSVQTMLYSDDPLWDGAGCMSPNNCCNFNTPPWFFKELQWSSNDDIEMRVCRNEQSTNEDIAIELVEIYIQ